MSPAKAPPELTDELRSAHARYLLAYGEHHSMCLFTDTSNYPPHSSCSSDCPSAQAWEELKRCLGARSNTDAYRAISQLEF